MSNSSISLSKDGRRFLTSRQVASPGYVGSLGKFGDITNALLSKEGGYVVVTDLTQISSLYHGRK